MESKEMIGLDDEMRAMVIDTIAQVRNRLLPKEKVLEFDKKEIFPEDEIREMLGPEIGLQLIFIPEEYGGMGGGARDCCAVTREMSKICLGVSTALFAIQLGADPILVAGTDEQQEKWLGKIAEGESLVAYAVTEPDAGSNLAALKTRAEPVKDDAGAITGYKITGNKQFISNGGYADFITLLAKTPEGPSFFVVEKGAEGFVLGKGEEKHGIRSSNTSPLSFEDVFVPVENLLGEEPGKGLVQANKVFGYTRLMVAAMALGGGEAAMDIAVSYAKERIQFNTPLLEKQGFTHKLIIPNIVRLKAADAYIEEIATRFDSGEQGLQTEGSIAKYFSSECANKAGDDAIQALGGYGYITEYEVEKIKRDIKITCIYEGTSEIQQNIISMFRWKNTWKTKGEYYEAIAKEMDKIHASIENAGAKYYALASRVLNEAIMVAHKNKLTKKQFVMFSLADMMTWVEIGAAMARKAQKINDEEMLTSSRIFANDVCNVVGKNAELIMGCVSEDISSEFKQKTNFNKLAQSFNNIVDDMDIIAEKINKS